ncbi:MAG: hypothetical protein HY738_11770 [Bacteroidia bacterium]|nr:hypothetical protein [Bacteroidia bacterium]
MNNFSIPLIILILLMTASYAEAQQKPSDRRKVKTGQTVKPDNNQLSESNISKYDAIADTVERNFLTETGTYFMNDEYMFSNRNIPERWSNESAVVLAHCEYNDFYFTSSFNHRHVSRKMIMVLDKNAVEFFSTFYFSTRKRIGLRVIKQDGTIRYINPKSGVKTVYQSTIPEFFRVDEAPDFIITSQYFFYAPSFGIKKLAIPDLETGDIIDYYTYYVNQRTKEAAPAVFNPLVIPLDMEYPILQQQYVFTIEKNNVFYNLNSYNGAPEIEENIDEYGKVKYTLIDHDREKHKWEIWSSQYISRPYIKFFIVHSEKKFNDKIPYFHGRPNEWTNVIKDEEVTRAVMNSLSEASANSMMLDKIDNYLRKNYLELKDTLEFINGVPKYFGKLNDILLPGEYDLFLKVKISNGKDIYLYPPDYYRTAGALPVAIGNTEVMIIETNNNDLSENNDIYISDDIHKPSDGKQISDNNKEDYYAPSLKQNNFGLLTYRTLLKQPSYTENVYDIKAGCRFNENFRKISVIKTGTISGKLKEVFSSEIIIFYDFIYNEISKYSVTKFKKSKGYPVDDNTQQKIMSDSIRLVNKRIENRKDVLSKKFMLEDYKSFGLINTGMNNFNSYLSFSEEYTISGLTKKAGDDFLFTIGKLIEDQPEIKNESRDRQNDLIHECAQSRNYFFEIEIPEDYRIEGIEQLTNMISNETGRFSSLGTVKDNKLILSVSVSYNNETMSKNNWDKFLEILDAASNFGKAQVLFKKN